MGKLSWQVHLGIYGQKGVREVIAERKRREQRNGQGVILRCFETLFVREERRHGPRVIFAFPWKLT